VSAVEPRVVGNTMLGAGAAVFAMEKSVSGEIAGNVIAKVRAMTHASNGIGIYGMMGASGLDPATGFEVRDNRISGVFSAVSLGYARENDVHENDISDVNNGLSIAEEGWPNRFWWNNVEADVWGVRSKVAPADISDGEGHGNWWGRTCPGSLFVPGVDGNPIDVTDDFAYGSRDA
jgi:hypothetical protein